MIDPGSHHGRSTEPNPPEGALGGLLRRAQALGRRRIMLAALADSVLCAALVVLLCATAAAITLRGDVLAWIAAGLLLGAWFTIGTRALRRAAGRFSSASTTARTIATTRGPLRAGAQEPGGDAALRYEILGAVEIARDRADSHSARSPELGARYVEDVAKRIAARDVDPRLAVPRPRWDSRGWFAAGIFIVAAISISTTDITRGWQLLLERSDGRPPRPPEPVWSSLRLELEYPEHTHRPPQVVPNPSGALRVPAGTRVSLQMTAREAAADARVLINYDTDELVNAGEPELIALQHKHELGEDSFSGSFVVRATGRWMIVLLDDGRDAIDHTDRRSASLPLELEPDRPPEIELTPVAQDGRTVNEMETVELRFQARDDFGLSRAELVVQLPDGRVFRTPVGTPPKDAKSWRQRHTWDLSQIPLEARSELIYFIEVRDNDPGLGLVALPDPPGKVTRSAVQRLTVDDEEAAHAVNIVSLATLRDEAVDTLAQRMTTKAFAAIETTDPLADANSLLAERTNEARKLLSDVNRLLAHMLAVIDALSTDARVRERDVATLSRIHERLASLQKVEAQLHEGLPPELELHDPTAVTDVLVKLRPHNEKMLEQFEDEIIRLDDLVDGQVIARIEALVARLQATQQKLVSLLQQLKSGDESVRPQIEQLEQRRREDLQRIAEARAMLRKEVGQEFMNLDAFGVLERMAEENSIAERLREGDVEGALERAQNELKDVQNLRDAVQGKIGAPTEESRLSPEERDRMRLLRELSRLQDQQGRLRAGTQQVHEQWRRAVADERADSKTTEEVRREANRIRDALRGINDARLGREARAGLEDAIDAMQRLASEASVPQARALQLDEAGNAALDGLRRAVQGADERAAEGKQVRQQRDRVAALQRKLHGLLPPERQALTPDQAEAFERLQQEQTGLQQQTTGLLGQDIASQLPEEGRRAVAEAGRAMQQGHDALGDGRSRTAVSEQSGAWDQLQKAIDSLRRGSPPPPAARGGEASTEAERDRSLRDEVMDAMRERAPNDFDDAVKRYYEELLR